jgi:hypothetical protein
MAREDRVGRRIAGFGFKEVVERADSGQPPVDGGCGLAILVAMIGAKPPVGT